MLIDDTEEYDLVWDKVYDKLKFKPSGYYRGHSLTVDPPFEIEGNFAVYGIEKMSASQRDSMQDMIREVFVSLTEKGKRMYALDWQHRAFLFDPRNNVKYNKDHKGYVTIFEIDDQYYEQFEIHTVGDFYHQELWVSVEELAVFNEHIIGKIQVIHEYSEE